MDSNAFPWGADWYATRVEQALGRRAFRDNFRVWFNDNADHFDSPPAGANAARLVNYVPSLYQALRDVTAWVEAGVAPPRSTRYDIVDSQVVVPNNAGARRGIQPAVDLKVDGATQVDVAAGETVSFRARVQVPPRTGQVVAVDWDFTGIGSFMPTDIGRPRETVVVRTTFTYTTPGVYFPVSALPPSATAMRPTPTPWWRTWRGCVSWCTRRGLDGLVDLR